MEGGGDPLQPAMASVNNFIQQIVACVQQYSTQAGASAQNLSAQLEPILTVAQDHVQTIQANEATIQQLTAQIEQLNANIETFNKNRQEGMEQMAAVATCYENMRKIVEDVVEHLGHPVGGRGPRGGGRRGGGHGRG